MNTNKMAVEDSEISRFFWQPEIGNTNGIDQNDMRRLFSIRVFFGETDLELVRFVLRLIVFELLESALKTINTHAPHSAAGCLASFRFRSLSSKRASFLLVFPTTEHARSHMVNCSWEMNPQRSRHERTLTPWVAL